MNCDAEYMRSVPQPGAVAAAVLSNVTDEVPHDDMGYVECCVCIEPCDPAVGTIVQWPCGSTPAHCFHHACVNENTMWCCPVCRGGPLPLTEAELERNVIVRNQIQSAAWPPLPPDGQQRIATMAGELRAWFTAPSFSITTSGLSRMLVPVIHHGLRQNRIHLAHRVTLASQWGGALIEMAWGRVCVAVGMQSQWEATLRAAVASVGRAVAGLSIMARSLLSLGMGINGYIPPTPDAERRSRSNLDYVAPGSQEHLLGAGDPLDFMYNAFGHASALMQDLEREYSNTVVNEAQASFTAEREAQDAEYAAAERQDEERGEEERQRVEAEQTLAGPVQLEDVRAARVRRLDGPTDSRGTSPTDGADNS